MSEFSNDERIQHAYDRKSKTFENRPYDEALDISQDLSNADSELGESRSRVSKSSNKDIKSKDPNKYINKQLIKNKPFDEALDFSGSEGSVDTDVFRQHSHDAATSQSKNSPVKHSTLHQEKQSSHNSHEQLTQIVRPTSSAPKPKRRGVASESKSSAESIDSSDSDAAQEDEDEEDDENSYDNINGVYRPESFAHLAVSSEIKDLFQYITRFEPQEREMKTTLKCFIPELIPAIGNMDSFIKVPRPDGKADELGLKFLDEPCAEQSDPTVLELQLRATSKRVQSGEVLVRSLDDASSNATAIDKWINSIADLHSSKPPPQVIYRQSYPELEVLMQEWPGSFQDMLEKCPLPSPELDISLPEYAKLLCSLLGIPTYENPIESLHVMFSLYLTIRASPDFQHDLNTTDGMTEDLQRGDGYKLYSNGNMDILQLNAFNDHTERK